jgi:hypothetical protein
VGKDGGGVQTLSQMSSPDSYPIALAVDATHVYWTALDGIRKSPRESGPASLLSSPDSGAAPDSLRAPPLGPIALDQSWVYFTSSASVFRVPKAGGATERLTLASDDATLRGLAVDEHFAYFGGATGRVLKVPKTGGQSRVIAELESSPTVTAVDDKTVYWFDSVPGGGIRRAVK